MNRRAGMQRPKVFISWSSGKDSAFALHALRESGEFEIAGLLTTVTALYDRVAMHGVRTQLLARQAELLGLPLLKVLLPVPCSNAEYEARMAEACAEMRSQGVERVVFGDLFLEDLRAYRIEKLAAIGMSALFPLWKRATRALAQEMIDAGIVAHVSCIDPRRLPASFAGRRFDADFLRELPAGVDPCGENGEFHTVVTAGPMFREAIAVSIGETVERDGFIFTDIVPL